MCATASSLHAVAHCLSQDRIAAHCQDPCLQPRRGVLIHALARQWLLASAPAAPQPMLVQKRQHCHYSVCCLAGHAQRSCGCGTWHSCTRASWAPPEHVPHAACNPAGSMINISQGLCRCRLRNIHEPLVATCEHVIHAFIHCGKQKEAIRSGAQQLQNSTTHAHKTDWMLRSTEGCIGPTIPAKQLEP